MQSVKNLAVMAVMSAAFTGTVQAASVDLNDWTAESYSAVSGFGAGVWTPAVDGSSVTQSVNGQPTLYYGDFDTYGTKVTGTIQAISGSGDDDFIGFVIGFRPGDTTNNASDFLLVDWKRASQNFDFGSPSLTPGGTADVGLAVSRVTGIPTADEFWQHVDYAANAGGSVEELQRGATLGATGWNFGTDYEFSFDFGPNNLQVFVNGNKELDIAGTFQNGRLGFYNFSQAGVRYSAFTRDPGSFPDPTGAIPEPTTWAMLILGFAMTGVAMRYRRRTAVSFA